MTSLIPFYVLFYIFKLIPLLIIIVFIEKDYKKDIEDLIFDERNSDLMKNLEKKHRNYRLLSFLLSGCFLLLLLEFTLSPSESLAGTLVFGLYPIFSIITYLRYKKLLKDP
jgi:hypothetical protein